MTVARRLFELPYYRAAIDVDRRGSEVRFRSRRTHRGVPPARFAATYEPTGEPTQAEPGSLESFLVERYRFYTGDNGRSIGEIGHDPWRLWEGKATTETNILFRANDVPCPEGEPVVQLQPGDRRHSEPSPPMVMETAGEGEGESEGPAGTIHGSVDCSTAGDARRGGSAVSPNRLQVDTTGTHRWVPEHRSTGRADPKRSDTQPTATTTTGGVRRPDQ